MKKPLIIERPDLQAWQQKAVFGALTAAFWVAWVFLWLPLITLLGWLFFGQRFRLHMIELNGYQHFLNVLAAYALVIAAMSGGLILWAMYNHFRFRGVDRRKEVSAPSNAEMGHWAQHPESVVARWREYAVMTVHHDPKGGIERVDYALNPRNFPAAPKSANEPHLKRVV